ncbi:PREDICTED: mucin-4 [Galeopterus variegatus]|uniref:Mucin-4 n=1 Tax=Galeopterus variegatus TaxID=482537 RepID=A0ABM0QKP5_GALVR|nr:PREDICTED: mucin-4 [Galeopterus variegatus]
MTSLYLISEGNETTKAKTTSDGYGTVSSTNTVQVSTPSVGISSTATPEHPTTVQTTSSTNATKISNPVSSTDSPSSAVGSTLTTAQESTSHALLTTTPATSSETSPSQPVTTDAFTHTPTSAASPSSNAEPPTPPLSTPTSSVITQGNPGDISETVTSTTTFDVSATAGRATQSMPLSTSTSPQESSADSHTDDTQTTQTTQESPTTSSVSPTTDTIKTVTTATSLFTPTGHSSSESVPQHASSTGEVTTFTPAPSRDSHTTQATTTEVWATPTSPDTLLRTSGGTELFITSTMPQATSKASTLGGPGGQSTWPPASTSPTTTPAISQTHQSQGTETTRDLHTTRLGSSVSDSTPAGTATSISLRASGRTTSASASPETSTSGKTTSFSPTFSTNSHTTQSTTELLSTAASPDTTPETPGRVSVTVSSTFSPTISDETTGRPPGLSTQSSSSTSPQEVSAISHMAQTQSTATTRGPETISVVSQATDTLATVPSPPPSFTPQGHTSTQTKAHTLSPMATSTTFICTPVSTATSISPSTATSGSTMKTETSGMITASLKTDSMRSTATSLSSTTSQTLVPSTPSASTGTCSTTPFISIDPDERVSLFPYGSSSGDLEFVRRTVDFTSQLFKPQIGFPLGSSLRDSLYFTDNGQIIFPESDYEIFSYPNPPQGGFTGQDTVALVAPFWDDADFSSRRGTIFYQEYETLYDEYNPLVQKVESWIEKFTNTWSYKARWTLKVTWVNAPAYPAQRTFGTNTYQAILSTDGSKSFTLFLYQSGGMQWDVTQHPGNSVLMGFSSGDGYYKNSPLTFWPEWEKYRPDRFLDSNSGLQGLQVYKLHRVERPNYRLKCLQWLKSQPQWPSWGWNQISCPCSWQQGRWDLRFQPVSIGWWGQGSRQLCSFSSWRGGVCCSYGLWGELLEGWRVWSPWPFDWKLEPRNWCCRWNDKPFFCALYQQRRPRIGCGGYRPPRPAWMFGDPHITTLDGANYTFNGLGDFLLVQAKDENSSFVLQGRTAQTGSAQATNFIAFAAQYNSSRLDPITVQWLLEPSDTIHVLLNNQTVTFETNHEDTEGQEIVNTTGVILTRNGSLVSASFDGTVTISVIALSNILHASSSLPEEYQNHTEGLLGVWNDNPEDDFKMPNGSTISRKSSEETFFHYGMTWKINGTGLLGERNDHVPSNFTPVFLSQLLKNNSDADLVSDCKGDTQCVYDTLATRNSSTGLHTRMLFRRYQQMNATLNEYPPSINGSHLVKAYKGQTMLTHYTSNSENVTFTLRNNCTDFKLFENGTLLWTPKSLEPFTLEILARDARVGLSSVLQPKTVVCTCSAESQCLYNLTSWVGNSSLEVADCKCDGDTFGRYCERSKDGCEEECFPNVTCIPRKGCEACPRNMTGDGRHCAALENSYRCQNQSCPVNYCYNQGHCYISGPPGCQRTCTCPPAFTDTRCFLAGNNFTPTICQELPLRIIQLLLSEEENASAAEVNASVAYILGTLDMRAFLWNSQVEQTHFSAPASGSSIQHWKVISEFQYRPRGPVIDFLNNRLLDAMVEAFLFQTPRRRGRTSEGPRNNVVFYPISRGDVHDVMALNISSLETYFECNGYKGYHLVYDPQSGFTCVSPCSEGYCDHGGQCQHLPDGPRCSCVSFSIYTPWGEHCEHLSVKLGAFFGILFGALGALLLLGVVVSVVLHFWRRSGTSYLLD